MSAPTCVYCGQPAQGNHSIHIDSEHNKPEVPLCDAHGQDVLPTCDEIWAKIIADHIKERRVTTHYIAKASGRVSFNECTWRVRLGPGGYWRWTLQGPQPGFTWEERALMRNAKP